jgi:chaperone modulatory protein CbpM
MFDREEFCLRARLRAEVLETWIEVGWLVPRQEHQPGHFSEIDLARAQLIRDIQEMGVNDEGVAVILDLVDQIHGLRRTLRGVFSAVRAEPVDLRHRIVAHIRGLSPDKRLEP